MAIRAPDGANKKKSLRKCEKMNNLLGSITTDRQKVALCGEVCKPITRGDISAHCLHGYKHFVEVGQFFGCKIRRFDFCVIIISLL